jgi:uncharacterized membrane protein YdbT with pleckstrin-like domain
MRYIDAILQPGEKVLFAGTIHWVVYFPAALMLALALAALTQAGQGPAGAIGFAIAAGFAVVGGAMALSAWFRRWTTEVDVTDRRIVYKRGFIKRHTVELNMDKVESVDVDQSVLGRLLDYGDITIRGTGIGIEPLRGIGSPLDFRNHVTAR